MHSTQLFQVYLIMYLTLAPSLGVPSQLLCVLSPALNVDSKQLFFVSLDDEHCTAAG